jgi:diacylglycerol kinase (ATP)
MSAAGQGSPTSAARPAPAPGRVIWNREAGQKAGVTTDATSDEQVRDAVAALGLADGLVEVGDGDGVREAARKALADGASPVVAAGGDGTVGLVASVLLGSDVPLGILPLGSVMNIARMLDIPRDLEAAARVVAAGVSRRIDVGLANGEVNFYEAASVGLGAEVFEHAQRASEGDLVGVRQAIRAALRYRPTRMDLEVDGRHLPVAALTVVVANGPYTGLGFTVAPEARLDDGCFDVAVFRHFSKLDLVRHFASIALGRHAWSPRITRTRGAAVRVTARRAQPARADGHDLGDTPVLFETLPSALLVLAPPARGQDEEPSRPRGA